MKLFFLTLSLILSCASFAQSTIECRGSQWQMGKGRTFYTVTITNESLSNGEIAYYSAIKHKSRATTGTVSSSATMLSENNYNGVMILSLNYLPNEVIFTLNKDNMTANFALPKDALSNKFSNIKMSCLAQ